MWVYLLDPLVSLLYYLAFRILDYDRHCLILKDIRHSKHLHRMVQSVKIIEYKVICCLLVYTKYLPIK